MLESIGHITGIVPDPNFDGWAEDALLDSGVAFEKLPLGHNIRPLGYRLLL